MDVPTACLADFHDASQSKTGGRGQVNIGSIVPKIVSSADIREFRADIEIRGRPPVKRQIHLFTGSVQQIPAQTAFVPRNPMVL